MNLLFLCNQNENRSLTAQHLFEGNVPHEIKSAGFYSEKTPVTKDILQWADAIFVFEEAHVDKLKKEWPDVWFEKRVICLDVEDVYRYMQDELVKVVEERMGEWWGMFD